MKRIFAVLLCVLVLCCLSVPALAEKSPVAEEDISVTVIVKLNNLPMPLRYEGGSTVELQADPGSGSFTSWSFYTADGKVAKLGTDYKVKSGKATDSSMQIIVLNDLIVCANYDGKYTDPFTAKPGSPISPKTGDGVALCLTVLLLSGVAVVYGSKKVFAK